MYRDTNLDERFIKVRRFPVLYFRLLVNITWKVLLELVVIGIRTSLIERYSYSEIIHDYCNCQFRIRRSCNYLLVQEKAKFRRFCNLWTFTCLREYLAFKYILVSLIYTISLVTWCLIDLGYSIDVLAILYSLSFILNPGFS